MRVKPQGAVRVAHLLIIKGSQGVCLQRDEEGDDAFCAGTSRLWARCCCRLGGGVVLRNGTVENRHGVLSWS